MRIKIIRIIIIVLFAVIALDLAYVQVIRGRYFFHLSTNNRIRIVPLEGWRGKIADRNGQILADSRISYNVMVAPQDLAQPKELFNYLAKELGEDSMQIERRYQRKKLAPFAPVTVVEDIPRDKAIVLEESKYRYPSLIIQQGFKRSYPLKKNSAHVLGHVGKINKAKHERFKEYGYTHRSIIGYDGIEEYYDSYLKGGEGGIQVEVNSRGQQVRLLSLKEPTRGQDISLTIDHRVQKIAMDVIEGQTGAVIVMDMDNGEILGMTSSPSYDSNVFADSKMQRRLTGLFSDKRAPLLNRAVKGQYPPGSVFKIPVAIGALDGELISEHTTYNCKGYQELGGRKFRCVHSHGPMNLVQSLARSCNIYYYRVGSILGAERIYQNAKMFGLGTSTFIDLPYEESGYLPSRRSQFQRGKKQWYAGDTLNYSVGQGDVLATPLQLVRMMATVGNDGVEVQPHVIKAIGGMPITSYDFRREVNVDKDVFKTVQKGLRAAVSDYSGTANVLNIPDLFVAGKTGTAQSSGEKEDHSWFVGYAKTKNKKIAFCVFLEHGGSSQNACLVSREMLLNMQKEALL